MLIAVISIFCSVVVWAVKSMATSKESYHQSVNDPLPRYSRPRGKRSDS